MSEADKDRRDGAEDGVGNYRVGNKKPPVHTRFKPGVSGNPRGRPKKRPKFFEILLEEFYRNVKVVIDGRSTNVANYRLYARRLVREGLTGGPHSARLLGSNIRAAEAERAAHEKEARDLEVRKAAEPRPFSWDEEHEKLLEDLQEFERNYVTDRKDAGARANIKVDDGDKLGDDI
jgi:hypothetical protein